MTSERWQQIERIYHEVVARPAAERPSFLEEACASDAELRAEVERMLACEDAADGFLESPAVEVAARALAADSGGLSAGSRLGQYEVVSLAGVGGMGEVWKARDTRLKRFAAIKVLPRELVSDPERKRRFVLEARSASALNHPNIVTIYEIGQAEGFDFIAMEYVEGKTLEEEIGRHGLKIGEALKIAVQVADALARAHLAGIVHRDLKPGNVMVTADGRVKLLDFGLAKLSEIAPDGSASTTSSARPATRPGLVMGTPQYMAPEQIEGKAADHRTDIFAFGLVLFELLTGKKAFEADSQLSLMAAILKEEPPAVPEVPPALQRLLKKCLAKEPDRRWQSAVDLRDELEWIASGVTAVTHSPSRRSMRSLLAATALCTLFAAAGWIGAQWLRRPGDPQAYEFAIPPPPGGYYGGSLSRGSPSQLSPDGRAMAVVIWAPGKPVQVWLRQAQSGTFAPVAGTEGVRRVAWSPDSTQLAVLTNQALLKVQAGGGVVQTLVEKGDEIASHSIAWGSGGDLIATDRKSGRLVLIPESGGNSKLLGELHRDRAEIVHGQPQFLPDGRHFLYFAQSSSRDKSAVYADSIDARPGRDSRLLVLASASPAVFAPASQSGLFHRPRGYLLTARGTTLVAYDFNPGNCRVEGEPRTLASQVAWGDNDPLVGASVSRTGVVALTSAMRDYTEAALFDRGGSELDFPFPRDSCYGPSFSNAGTKLAIACTNPDTQQQDLWVYDLARSSKSRFAPVANWQGLQLWSPDDREITFVAVGESETQRLLYRRDADGLRAAEKILGPASYISPYDWSRDGRRLIYGVAPTVWSRDGRRLIYGVSTTASRLDLWILPLEDGGKPYPFLESDYSARFARFSPDGRFVAFSWSPSGQDEVYVRPLDRSKNRQWQVSMDGGTQPRWSKDGKQIYFFGAGGKLMSAAVKLHGDEFVSAAPVPIMPLPRLPFTFSGYLYDVSPRGDRVVFIRTSTTRGSPPIRVILNWEGLLKP